MFAQIRFEYDIMCTKCKQTVAREAQISNVFEESGKPSYEESIPFDYDDRAVYVISCKCGVQIEVRSPDDVERLKSGFQNVERRGPDAVRIV
ncbi:MAG TPA: hypothetical protein VGG22_07060 [Candidatus Baltobacteraceae bacterium]|jgi:hypothetical protein